MTAPQDLWAIPLAKRLVDRFRSQAVTYVKVTNGGAYDEEQGVFAPPVQQSIQAAGAVVKSMKGERDGVQQGHEVVVWIDHETVPWPISTADWLEYLGKKWKIVSIEPSYGSGGGEAGPTPFKMYASRITARAE